MRRVKQTIYLIPEQTYLTGLNGEVNFHIMKDLAEESNVEPFRRIETFSNFINRFNNNQTISKELEKWGISLKIVHHPVLSRNFCDIRSNIYTDIMDEYTKKRATFFLIIIPQNNAEVYKVIKIKSFDKGRPVAIKLKQHVIDKLGLASWGLSQDIYKGPNATLTYLEPKITVTVHTLQIQSVNGFSGKKRRQNLNKPPENEIYSKLIDYNGLNQSLDS
ncbi:hypothetical protein ACTFIZ_008715 [Dictyostelium cf. discoideum]